MENDFRIDPLYGLDKAIKTKLISLGLSSEDAVRGAAESGELLGVAAIGARTISDIKYWLELLDKRNAKSDSDNIDLVLGYPLKAGQIKIKSFVVSLSNHERLNRPPFDKLRANG